MDKLEKIIHELDSTMSMEGFPLAPEDKERIRICLESPEKFNTTVNELVEKHRVVKP